MSNSPGIAEQIRMALDEATPGPWKLGPGCIYTNHTGTVNPVCVTPNKDENAHLIANAPTWLRALLEENEQLQSQLTESRKLWGECEAQNQQLREELERVKRKYDLLVDVEFRQCKEIESLRSELAAKDKVLEWYANQLELNHTLTRGKGAPARSILSQYKESPNET